MTQTTKPPKTSDSKWSAETESFAGLDLHPLESGGTPKDPITGPSIRPSEVGWMPKTEAASNWIAEHKMDTLELPPTYPEIENYDPYVARVEGDLKTGVGHGITANVLEAALRVITGGGRYTADHFAIHPCRVPEESRDRWVLQTPTGYMFVHYDYQTDEPENIDREVSETISTPQGPLEIAEEKESVLAGLEEVAEILDGVFDIQLAAHVSRPKGGNTVHTFEMKSGKEIEIEAWNLPDLKHRIVDSRENLRLWNGGAISIGDEGDHETGAVSAPKPRRAGEYPFEVQMNVSAEEIPDAVGETKPEDPAAKYRTGRIVVGYKELLQGATNVRTGFPVVSAEYKKYELVVSNTLRSYSATLRPKYSTTKISKTVDPSTGDVIPDIAEVEKAPDMQLLPDSEIESRD
jgi:hypothetical protein